MCTGFAVGPRLVWTAKHCVDTEERLRILQGGGRGVATKNQGTAELEDFIGPTDKMLAVASIGSSVNADLAFVELVDAIDSWVEVEEARMGNGSFALLVGFGKRRGLIGRRLKGYIEVVHADDKEAWGKAAAEYGYGEGACVGDSGAGLFSMVEGRLAVVASLSQGHARCNGADRYVRLTQSVFPRTRSATRN